MMAMVIVTRSQVLLSAWLSDLITALQGSYSPDEAGVEGAPEPPATGKTRLPHPQLMAFMSRHASRNPAIFMPFISV